MPYTFQTTFKKDRKTLFDETFLKFLPNILKRTIVLTDYMLKILNELGLIESKTIGGKVYYKNAKITNIHLKKDSNYSLINPIYSYFENIKNWENLPDIFEK